MYELTPDQLDGVSLGLTTIAMYLIAFSIIRRKTIITLLGYYFATVLYGFSPLYNIMVVNSPEATFTVYSAIYLTAFIKLHNDGVRLRTTLLCLAMAAFCIVGKLALNDGVYDERTSTIIYNNYKLVVTLLHLALICSLVRKSEIGTDIRHFGERILGYCRDYSCALPC